MGVESLRQSKGQQPLSQQSSQVQLLQSMLPQQISRDKLGNEEIESKKSGPITKTNSAVSSSN